METNLAYHTHLDSRFPSLFNFSVGFSIVLSNTKKSMRRTKRCSWKGSWGMPASRGHQAEVPGALGAVFWCMVAVVQYAEMLDWALKARLDALVPVPEVALTSLPIRALQGVSIPLFSLQYAGSKSHRQAWKAS